MLTLASLNGMLLQVFAILLIWAAVADLRSFTIPNRVSLSIALLYPAHVLTASQPIDWMPALGIAAVAFAAGAFAFSRGWFGGGDVKLFTASILWAGPGLLAEFLFVCTVAGALLSVAALALPWISAFLPKPIAPADGGGTDDRPSFRTHIPYGVAIAAGGLAVAFRLIAA